MESEIELRVCKNKKSGDLYIYIPKKEGMEENDIVRLRRVGKKVTEVKYE